MTEMMELVVVGALIAGLFLWKRAASSAPPAHTERTSPPDRQPVTDSSDLQWGIGNRAGVQDRLEDMTRANGEPTARYRIGNNPYTPSRYQVDPELEAAAAQIVGFSGAPRTPSHYAKI